MMRKKFLFLSVVIASSPLLMAMEAHADLNLALGITSVDTAALRITHDREYDLSHWHPQLDLRLATGILLLDGDDYQDNAAWVVTPAFRYHFNEQKSFVEAGIGAGLFAETRVESRELSTAFHFESRVAAGWQLGSDSEIGVSAIHYSNARIKNPNDGLEIYSLIYRYHW
jgi:lipid A 3-O-deacylase